MLQTLNCIRMGEVLFDENLELFILCTNCHTDFRNLEDFRQHLEKCDGLESLFQQGAYEFKYNTDKCSQLFGKTLKGIKEFLIYDYNDVEVTCTKTEVDDFIDLTNIEQELLDPKWYSDLNVEVSNTSSQKSSKQYDELVEAVTPFVQFKENLKSNNNGRNNAKTSLVKSNIEFNANTKETDKTYKNVKFDLTTNKTRPTAKRKLSISKTAPLQFAISTTPADINAATRLNSTTPVSHVSNFYASKKRKSEPTTTSNGFIKPTEIKPITTIHMTRSTNMLPPKATSTNVVLNTASKKTTAIPTAITEPEATKEKQTAQILNKLQNLGLQVKRTQPQVVANSSVPNKTDKTLEILQRLQLKGMKVKILNKQLSTETNVNASTTKLRQGLLANPAQKSFSDANNSPAGNIAIKQNLSKNLIIKRVK